MGPSSWQKISSDFRQGAAAYPDVCAHWDSGEGLWTLRSYRTGERPKLAEPDAQRAFAETARAAVRRLGKPLHEQPPWHIWLDLMRKSKRGYASLRVAPWRVYKAAAEGRGNSDRSAYPIVGGTIDHVFQVSAEFCGDLAFDVAEAAPPDAAQGGFPKAKQAGAANLSGDESTRTEVGSARSSGTEREKAQQKDGGSTPQTDGKKKRGRPTTIPDCRKTKAAEVKDSGGTNRDAAKVLYDTFYPTNQQTKNVPAILRHHRQKTNPPGAPVNPRQATPKPQ